MTPRATAEAIASLGLAGAGTEVIEVEKNADEVVRILDDNRVLGVAVRGLATGAITAQQDVIDTIHARHDQVMTQTMRIEIEAIRVSALLAEADIEHRLLKGAALAHTVAHAPDERSFRDVDLLVPGTSISDAVTLLTSHGAERLQPELRPGYDARFAKSVTMRLDTVEIDLHRLLCPGPFGVWMRPNDLFLLSRSIEVAGRRLPTLDGTDHLVHACYHAALGQAEPVLSNLRDIALLATDADVERFDETVARWRGRAVIRRAVGLVQGRLDGELPDALTRYLHEPTPADELAAIAPYLTDDARGRFAALAPSTLKALPLSDRPAYALAVGLPAGSDPVDRIRSIVKRGRT